MIFEDIDEVRRRAAELTGRQFRGTPTVHEDTTDFMSIDYGSVLRLAGNDYLVMGHAREGRFGIDEQPKFWVKSCIDLDSGQRTFIKLVFEEAFDSRVGTSVFRCVRSARKESAVLDATRGNGHFMQGQGVLDAAGNLVRVIRFVKGPSLYEHLRSLELPHDVYFHQVLPARLRTMIDGMAAIAELHAQGLHHGDIRADHVLLSEQSGEFVWIDFDYDVDRAEYDVFCLGNVLLQVVGKGRHALHDVRQNAARYPHMSERLTPEDMSLMFPHRVANLRKLFPHVSADLNEVLMRFAVGSAGHYHQVSELLDDLRSIPLP